MQPYSPERHIASPADLALCRLMIREGSKSFHLASLLLPERVREPARALYAFCRVADDEVDRSRGGEAAIGMLEKRLAKIYAGEPDGHPADRAFADAVHRFAIPRALPEALIEGFAWDVEGRMYDSISDVRAYSARVAGTVGAMMSVIMGVRDPRAIARACDLGIAMQLTNIARDVGEDARAGRLYLPRQWLEAEGIDPRSWLASPAFVPGIGAVVSRLLEEADALYARAGSGIGMLPASCRPAIQAASSLYAAIGREIERHGRDSVGTRAVVPKRRKAALMAAAIAAATPRRKDIAAPPLAEARFLVEAVANAPSPRPRPRGVEGRTAWLVDLFLRLENQRP
jgi:phytoene synthase